MKDNKKLYAVIGTPLGHTYSPRLHNYWIKKKRINAKYKKFDIKKNRLKKIIKQIKKKEIYGLNVTIPHKVSVINFLDKIEGNARITRSVNTILYKKGKIIGENTDVHGVENGFIKKIHNIKNKSVYILGAGGVVPSIILALKKHKVKKIVLCNRTGKKIKKIKQLFKQNFHSYTWKNRNKFISKADVIFNATSLGMKNKPNLHIDTNLIRKKSIYCEVIYNPLETKTIKKLKKLKIKTLSGLNMFINQAQQSFYLWHKQMPKLSSSEKIKIFKNLYD
tara:strand:- start:66 stop:899 length:834 start_codon:yes stop_codon:yes gene_type:complete